MPSKKTKSKRPVVRRTSPTRCSAKERAVITTHKGSGVECKWLSNKKAKYWNGTEWSEAYSSGCDLFECLTRPGHRHRIKRIEPNTEVSGAGTASAGLPG